MVCPVTKFPTDCFLYASIGTSLKILNSEFSINWSVIVEVKTLLSTSV